MERAVSLPHDDISSRGGTPPRLDDTAIDVFLDPGEYFVGDASCKVRTLLGSCVAMVLWHPRMRYGAMSHFLLSSRIESRNETRNDALTPPPLEGKYADEALELMVRELQQAKVPLHECVAKIFGGGNMFPDQKMADKLNVGQKNGETARRLLRDRGFRIVAEDLFGIGHRQVIFNVCNGDVWSRQDSQAAMPPT
jgi:chemotaxis protein CheD